VKTLAYNGRKKKKEKLTWDKFRNQLKDEFKKTKEIAKETYQGIKKQFNEEKPRKKITQKKKKTSIDSNLELFCPFCEYTIPNELKPSINNSISIVCENCGTEIKKSSFFKEYSFPN